METCRCQQGYIGPSCENCDTGFSMYQWGVCEPDNSTCAFPPDAPPPWQPSPINNPGRNPYYDECGGCYSGRCVVGNATVASFGGSFNYTSPPPPMPPPLSNYGSGSNGSSDVVGASGGGNSSSNEYDNVRSTTPYCECYDGYYGTHCENESPCADDCNGRGWCRRGTCSCMYPFHGGACDIVDACPPDWSREMCECCPSGVMSHGGQCCTLASADSVPALDRHGDCCDSELDACGALLRVTKLCAAWIVCLRLSLLFSLGSNIGGVVAALPLLLPPQAPEHFIDVLLEARGPLVNIKCLMSTHTSATVQYLLCHWSGLVQCLCR